jgi:heme A synthase
MATTFSGRARGADGPLSQVRSRFELRYFALVTVVATYGLIVLGGVVRATDSGTACPDWPLCHGQVVPPADIKVWIEFSHRLVASIVGFMILGLVYAIWRTRRADTPLWRAALFVTGLLVLQVVVGGVTVGTETAAGIVAIHLSIALTLIATLIFITARLLRPSGAASGRLDVLPVVAAAGLFALVITGAFVSQREAGLAYSDWPLFEGQVTPSSSEAGQLHYGHRVLAGVVGLLLLAVFVLAVRVRAAPPVIWGMSVVVAVFGTQVLLGASNIWFELATSLRIAHLALASAVWAVLVFTLAWAQQNGLRLTRETG